MLEWADELRRLGVRANADSPRDAARARDFGAEGIGLCRTEHMFFGADRDQLVKEMFVAAEQWRRAHTVEEADVAAVDERFRAQPGDAEASCSEPTSRGSSTRWRGLPVTIRLLDPPLHEFLPVAYFEAELCGGPRRSPEDDRARSSGRWRWCASCDEANPMLGTRGVRLGDPLPADLRDAGAGDRRGGGPYRERPGSDPHRRDHAAADRLRDASSSSCASWSMRAARGGAAGGWARGPLRDRDDDRAAARLPHRRADRRARRLLQLRDQRPHADGARALARRRRGEASWRLHRARDPRPQPVRDDRRARGRGAGADGGRAWDARRTRTSSSGSAASTAATRTRSPSSTRPGSTT